jgi:hypothetical protein
MPTIQVAFSRINPAAPPHLLRDDEMATASNVDLALGGGGLTPRRGCTVFGTVTSSARITQLHRIYNNASDITAGPFYAHTHDGKVYRGSGATWTLLATGGATTPAGMASVQNYAVIASAGTRLKDDGTTTTEWIKQSPGAPTITVSTLAPLDLLYGGAADFTTTEGTNVAGESTGTITSDPSADSRVVLTLSFGGVKDLSTNAGQAIGDYGVHFVDLGFSDPSKVLKISQDYSIGDANFYDYWHTELSPQSSFSEAGQADPAAIVDAQLSLGGSTVPLSQADREAMISALRENPRLTLGAITRVANTYAPWAVARPDFTFVGSDPNAGGANPWSTVYAMRIVVELTGACTVMAKDPAIHGGENYPLTDLDIGYSWWQTYATFDSTGQKIGESAPSPASSRTRLQNARALVALTGAPTGSIHGITHVITYRQGGYTRDAYAVSTATYTGTFTTTDTLADLRALSLNYRMPRNILADGSFPGNVEAIAPSFNERVFIASGNLLRWTLPGQMDTFPTDGYAQVGPVGDTIKALLPWNPGLVIVNQYSVYEFAGDDLENGQFRLTKSGSKHGSIPARVPCLTPYGIPLLNYDGLTMYIPGQGEQEIPWLMELYGDMFRGAASTDPAARKGARIPAINRGYILNAAACYAENKLYLAVPTGSFAYNDTLFVIDFATQRVWWYTYTFGISSLLWDHQDSRLFAGTSDGRVMQLETGSTDVNTSGGAVPIQWTARTRQWAAPTDSVFENVAVDAVGGGLLYLQGFYDDPSSPVVGTITGSRQWHRMALSGSFARNAEFLFTGSATDTTTTSIFQLSFDHLTEPERVHYYKTPYDDHGSPNQKLWDVANHSFQVLHTGTISAVSFVDGTALMTYTEVGPTAGRVWRAKSFPSETYGKLAYSTYTTTDTAVQFKLWDGPDRFEARVEPPQVSTWRTDIESMDEAICDGFDSDINPAGTTFGTCYVDNTAVTTGTFVGTSRQSFTTTIPVETYGRTIHVLYSGTLLKHYRTWFHRRPEPDRWTSWVSDKQGGDEHEWKVFKPEVAVFGTGGTCTATVFVDNTALSTHTLTGSMRHQDTLSLPYASFGRTIWVRYSCSAGATAKHYSTDFEGTPEPPRVTSLRVGPFPLQADSHFKTWLPELDPLGGTVTGTLYANGTAISTQTFAGSGRQRFEVGVDLVSLGAIREGRTWEARYAVASGQFKHYDSKLDTDTQGYKKTTWAFSYKKLGGSSQVDLPRFWSLQWDAPALSTCTYTWANEVGDFSTGTLTCSAGSGFRDRISFPPNGRGRIFECRLHFDVACGVDAVAVDFLQEGIKGLTRRGVPGDPQ